MIKGGQKPIISPGNARNITPLFWIAFTHWAAILILASTTESIFKGILLLSSYSLGLAIPFIFAGYATQKFLLISKNIKQKMNIITKTGGVLLLITGVLILTNKLQVLGFYILEYVPILSKIG